jgi:tRNA pseudouridine55 synthase
MNGVLIIDKPQGWTSHDVVNRVRRLFKEKRIGHAGTLDPLATGVLVVCAGTATRIVRYLESDDKEYTATLRLGITTDTQDADGRPLASRSYPPPSRAAIETVLNGFRGAILQRPPAYSALKINGVPSYRLARSGRIHQHPERAITIHAIDLLGYEDPLVRIRVRCSKGTYVRTLCADIGDRLGAGAHLTKLERNCSGRFRLDQAVSMDQLAEHVSSGKGEEIVINLNSALEGLPEIVLAEDEVRRIRHGNDLAWPSGQPYEAEGGRIRLMDHKRQLVAVGVTRMNRVHPETVLV